MAYHLLIAYDHLPEKPIFDKYLGTAMSIDVYWESIGRKYSLPIISSITERADSEEGFVIENNDLFTFKKELFTLENYWKHQDTNIEVPDRFFDDIRDVREGVDLAIKNGLKIIIG